MDKYFSYTDFLKAVGQYPKVREEEKLLNEIYLDLFLNRLQRMHRISQLEVLINGALDSYDAEAFYAYAAELKEIKENLNTTL